MARESEQKLVMTSLLRLLLVFGSHWKLGGSSGEHQTVTRVNFGPEIAAILL